MAYKYPPCTYRVSVKGVITIDNQLVLVKEDCDQWDLPGGGPEHHEDLETAFRREIQEELGVNAVEISTDKVQPWSTFDLTANRPLLFLVYPAKVDEVPPMLHGNVLIGLFSKKDVESMSLVKHIEKFRGQLIETAFGDSKLWR